MATLILMRCTDDRKKINKHPAPLTGDIQCAIKDNSSIINPVMIISKERLGDQWAAANYANIPDYGGRYYFINNIEVMTGGRIALHMTVDPLMTYAGELMSTSFMVARSEVKGSPYFIDAEKALQGNKVVYYDILGNIPQDATGNKYVLTVAGGF